MIAGIVTIVTIAAVAALVVPLTFCDRRDNIEIDSDSIPAIMIIVIIGSRWDRWRLLAKWKPGLRDKLQAFKPKTLLLTDSDHLLTREGPEKVGSFYSKTLTSNIDHRNWTNINTSMHCSKFAVVHHVVYSLWVG